MSIENCQTLPRSADIASLCGVLFKRLGGDFSVSSTGQRYVGKPASTRYLPSGMPTLPDALPHEGFRSEAEWRGALKLVEYLISRLDDADSELIFGAFAAAAVNEREPFDFRDRL